MDVDESWSWEMLSLSPTLMQCHVNRLVLQMFPLCVIQIAMYVPLNGRNRTVPVKSCTGSNGLTPSRNLTRRNSFQHWRRGIVGWLETWECIFLLDPLEPAPHDLLRRDLAVARTRAGYLIESLSQYFWDLVRELCDPKEIMV